MKIVAFFLLLGLLPPLHGAVAPELVAEVSAQMFTRQDLVELDDQEQTKISKLARRFARRYGFHPKLILAVIKVESGFRRYAVSNKGALGLMQVMPKTGQWIAKRCGIEFRSASMLFDPEANIWLGVCYLSYLKRKFDGDFEKILTAYNMGPAKVTALLADGREIESQYFQRVIDARKGF